MDELLTKLQIAHHYKRCINSKRKLIEFYEKKGNDGAVDVLEREIHFMTLKGKAIVKEIRDEQAKKL